MTARLTLSCDGRWPLDGTLPAFPCRGTLHLHLDPDGVLGEPGDLVDVDDRRDVAERAGWSSTRTARVTRDYCPAHTRHRASLLLALDPRWAGHPQAARSAVLELVVDDTARGHDVDRARLAELGIDPAGFDAAAPYLIGIDPAGLLFDAAAPYLAGYRRC